MPSDAFDAFSLVESVHDLSGLGRAVSERFLALGVGSVDDHDLFFAVRAALDDRSALREAWQKWSFDKRWSPSPYLDGLEVGHFDGKRLHVRHHAVASEACADFIVAEVRWIVERRVTNSPLDV